MRPMAPLVAVMLAVIVTARCGWCAPMPEPPPTLKTAHAVPVPYYLSLPHGWTPQSTWPILVTIDGSGHDFLKNCQQFTQARGDHPFIIVTPCVRSNGNDPADEEAVLAIVREVQQEDGGRQKFFLTGFSAGGHLTWQVVFAHPDLLAAAVLAAGNFVGRGIGVVSDNPARVHLPIQGFQGDQDPHLTALNAQWDHAASLAHDHGYQNAARTMVPGAGHNAFPGQVIAFCATLLSPSK